ncbi:MAG: LPS assembly lipoprotein LptE [Gammaproteobacteria bacterium]
MKNSLSLLLCILSLCLAACGFQLRGTTPIPESIQRLAIEPNDPYLPFQQEIRGLLLSYNGLSIVNTAQKPDAILYILSDDFLVSDTSIGADGRIREKSYNYKVSFTLKTASGQTLIPPQVINSMRIIEFNPDLALAQTMEAQIIRNETRKDVANQLVRWLTMAPDEPIPEAPAKESSNAVLEEKQ